MRYWWLALAIACKPAQDPSEPGDDDDDAAPSAPTGDSAPDLPEPKLVREVRFRALIAWNATDALVVNPKSQGSPFSSVYLVELYEEGWTAEDEDSSCFVAIELAGTALSPFAEGEGYQWGLDIPEGADGKSAFSDCLERGFDLAQFTDEDPTTPWIDFDWTLRFGGELSAELQEWLAPGATADSEDLAIYAAGAWSSETSGYETDPDDNFWYAYPMDDANEVDFDNLLQRDEMVDVAGRPVTAYFVFDQRVFWTLDDGTTL